MAIAVLAVFASATAAVAFTHRHAADSTLGIPTSRLPRSKQQALARASATSMATETSLPIQPPPPVTEVGTRSEGIDFDQNFGPFASSSFRVEDAYQGPVQDAWYVVYAGQLEPYDKASGTLSIYKGPLDLNDGAPNAFVGDFTESGASDLKVTGIAGQTLTLVDLTTGAPSTFDLNTLEFGAS